MKQLIYLDNAATTKTRPEVVEAMLPYFTEYYGNPSSVYEFSAEPKRAIAQARETIAKALGAKVIGVRRTGTDKPDFVDELIHTDKLDEYLPQADCVAITLPGTTATKGMFDAERMAKMKDGAILLNVGRGMIVDTDALCAALKSGKLAGAGVDVTDPEPLPADHPLWKMENAVITPHISGGYHLQETHDRIVRIMAENLKRFLAGEPLRNVVDLSTGYRKL